LATRGSKIPIVARSAGSPHDRARKPAQDAASRDRELAMNDFSDGWKTSLTKTHFKAPSTRKRHADLWQRVLDGAAETLDHHMRKSSFHGTFGSP
jgi:hypothetical protein